MSLVIRSKKNCTSLTLACLLDTLSKFALLSISHLKDEKLEEQNLIKKQTYMKTEAYKLFSRVLLIFLPKCQMSSNRSLQF